MSSVDSIDTADLTWNGLTRIANDDMLHVRCLAPRAWCYLVQSCLGVRERGAVHHQLHLEGLPGDLGGDPLPHHGDHLAPDHKLVVKTLQNSNTLLNSWERNILRCLLPGLPPRICRSLCHISSSGPSPQCWRQARWWQQLSPPFLSIFSGESLWSCWNHWCRSLSFPPNTKQPSWRFCITSKTTDNKHKVDWNCPDKTGKWRREPANIKIVQTKNVLTRNTDVTEVKGHKQFSLYFLLLFL